MELHNIAVHIVFNYDDNGTIAVEVEDKARRKIVDRYLFRNENTARAYANGMNGMISSLICNQNRDAA